jgi:hypothetical protein
MKEIDFFRIFYGYFIFTVHRNKVHANYEYVKFKSVKTKLDVPVTSVENVQVLKCKLLIVK